MIWHRIHEETKQELRQCCGIFALLPIATIYILNLLFIFDQSRLNVMNKISHFISSYRSILLYTLSVAFGRGLSIFALPFVARFMPPSEYARLDVAASIIEISGIIASFALADLMFRFAASAKSQNEQRRIAGGVLGIGLVCAGITLLLTQIFLPILAANLTLGVSEPVLRAGLAIACCTGLIELPLAWLRMRDKPGLYLAFIAGRSIAQMAIMLTILYYGYGPEGVILGNAALDAVLTLYLVIRQIRGFGVYLSREMLHHALHYSLPIVGGSLAMFGLGTCDRFFLSNAVNPQTLAHYTLAGKLAFATPLLMQPFALWWNPKRIALLGEPDGLKKSAQHVGYGLVLLVVACIVVIITGSLFLHLAMPISYHGAIAFLPFLVVLIAMNELCTLLNVGSFAKSHSGEILLVNGVGGMTAVIGYILFVPNFGIYGAILATFIGHGTRIVLFLVLGKKTAPIHYPLIKFVILLLNAGLLIYIRPDLNQIVMQILFLLLSLMLIMGASIMLDLVPRFIPNKTIGAK
jgi:O-antigen/teichoic acid export membrane protein